MRDPYLYKDVPVLRNKLHIREQDLLDDAEADYVVFRLKDLALNPLEGDYHTPHLLKMHDYIFQDIFEWALVAYNAYFADGSDFSKKEYLERIVYDALG